MQLPGVKEFIYLQIFSLVLAGIFYFYLFTGDKIEAFEGQWFLEKVLLIHHLPFFHYVAPVTTVSEVFKTLFRNKILIRARKKTKSIHELAASVNLLFPSLCNQMFTRFQRWWISVGYLNSELTREEIWIQCIHLLPLRVTSLFGCNC